MFNRDRVEAQFGPSGDVTVDGVSERVTHCCLLPRQRSRQIGSSAEDFQRTDEKGKQPNTDNNGNNQNTDGGQNSVYQNLKNIAKSWIRSSPDVTDASGLYLQKN